MNKKLAKQKKKIYFQIDFLGFFLKSLPNRAKSAIAHRKSKICLDAPTTRARPDRAYEFPDRTGPNTQICRTGPAGPD